MKWFNFGSHRRLLVLPIGILALVLAVVAMSGVPTSEADTDDTWSGATTSAVPNTVGSTNTATTVHGGTTTSAPAEFRYNYVDIANNGNSGAWQFDTVASNTRAVPLNWNYSGFHAFFQVTVSLEAFVFDGVTTTTFPLVNAGPVNCCASPSAGFNFSGNLLLPVNVGDMYGFKMTGSNGDSDSTLRGTLLVEEHIHVADGCDIGGGSNDIDEVKATSDGTSIEVHLNLCTDIDDPNKTQYKVHFDYKDGLATDADRNDDGVIDIADLCATTSDDTMKYGAGSKETGPGNIDDTTSTDMLWYSVTYAELGLSPGDTVLIWADTNKKNEKDRAPNTDGSNCNKPDVLSETIELILQ